MKTSSNLKAKMARTCAQILQNVLNKARPIRTDISLSSAGLRKDKRHAFLKSMKNQFRTNLPSGFPNHFDESIFETDPCIDGLIESFFHKFELLHEAQRRAIESSIECPVHVRSLTLSDSSAAASIEYSR